MKLAEALQERADLKKNIANLRERLERVVLVQEGERPVEDPQELMRFTLAAYNAGEGRLQDILNYAAYAAEVRPAGGGLAFAEDIHGMWDMARYIHLLMGEIPRLTDDANGYGPNGRGFIAHVDIPEAVAHAFEALKAAYGGDVRVADPRYASDR